MILRLIEAETKISARCRFCFIRFILNIHPGVFTRALCVFMKIFFSLVFCFVFVVRGEGDCFVRPISVFCNIIAILIDLFCCLNYTFLFTNLKNI